MQRALTGRDATYLQSPYMSQKQQMLHLRHAFRTRIARRTGDWREGHVAHALRMLDVYLENPLPLGPGETVLDQFKSKLGLLSVDLSHCVYNWTETFGHEAVQPSWTVLWYAKNVLNGVRYMHNARTFACGPRVDLREHVSRLGRRLLLIRLNAERPMLVRVEHRYFSPAWGATRAGAGEVPARGGEPETWLLAKRNLFVRDEVPRKLTVPGRRDVGSVRLKVVRILTFGDGE
jgi:hypothetical protein